MSREYQEQTSHVGGCPNSGLPPDEPVGPNYEEHSMKREYITAFAVTVMLSGGAAIAQNQHGQQSSGNSGMMGGDMASMHQKMMSKHKSMMQGGGMMGAKKLMGPQFHDLMDANDDGKVEAAEARTQLQKLLEENDTDGDGALSISEFEVLHSRMIRETMVDRFQHLDSDGDGAVTAEEMTAPAEQIERKEKRMNMMMEMMQKSSGSSEHGMRSGGMMDGGHEKKEN